MKIFAQDYRSIIESWYLGVELSNLRSECDIFVNPESTFVGNRVIIITTESFNWRPFIGHNIVISRFPLECDDYLFLPYNISSRLKVKVKLFTRAPELLTEGYFTKSNSYCVEGSTLYLDSKFVGCDDIMYSETKYLTQLGVISKLLNLNSKQP